MWIPGSIGGNLGVRAFEDCTALGGVWLEEGVTEIPPFAFARCETLSCVEMHEGLEVIDDLAFWNCSNLAFIRIPRSVKRIGASAFENCSNLRMVVFEGVPEQISPEAFKGCDALNRIYVPLQWDDALTRSVPELGVASVKALSEDEMKAALKEQDDTGNISF